MAENHQLDDQIAQEVGKEKEVHLHEDSREMEQPSDQNAEKVQRLGKPAVKLRTRPHSQGHPREDSDQELSR